MLWKCEICGVLTLKVLVKLVSSAIYRIGARKVKLNKGKTRIQTECHIHALHPFIILNFKRSLRSWKRIHNLKGWGVRNERFEKAR